MVANGDFTTKKVLTLRFYLSDLALCIAYSS